MIYVPFRSVERTMSGIDIDRAFGCCHRQRVSAEWTGINDLEVESRQRYACTVLLYGERYLKVNIRRRATLGKV